MTKTRKTRWMRRMRRWIAGATRVDGVLCDRRDADRIGLESLEPRVLLAAAPVIGSLSASSARIGETVTLTASGLDGMGDTFDSIDFFLDSNQNGTLDVSDQLLAEIQSPTTASVTATPSTAGFPTGQLTYFARAQSTGGLLSNVVTATGNVKPMFGVPIVGSLSANDVPQGLPVTLTAGALDGNGSTIGTLRFYADTDQNGVFDNGDLQLAQVSVPFGAGSITVTPSTTGLPIGSILYFAQAQSITGVFGDPTAVTANVLTPVPRISAVLVNGPTTIAPGNKLVLIVAGVFDDLSPVNHVEVYADTDGNGTLNPATDLLLGQATNGTGGAYIVNATGATTALLPTGVVMLFARAINNLGGVSRVVTTPILVNGPPRINSLTATPNPVQRGARLTLIAHGVVGGLTGISSVKFYRDSDGNDMWDAGDQLIATGFGSSGNIAGSWVVSSSTPTGVNRFFARAFDNSGKVSTPVTVTVVVGDAPPIGVFRVSTNSLNPGQTLGLSVIGARDIDGTITSIQFFRDADGDGLFDAMIDDPLGAGPTLLIPPPNGFPSGPTAFFAVLTDNENATTVLTQTVRINAAPTIASLSAAPDPVGRGTKITLTANNVVLDGTTLRSVAFYLDSDNSGTINAGDKLVATGAGAGANITVMPLLSKTTPLGAATFLARATDARGNVSNIVSTTVTVENAAPVATAFRVSTTSLNPGKPLTLSVLGARDPDGPAPTIQFFMDDGDGMLDPMTDTLLGTGTSKTITNTAGFTPGPTVFFALLTDNLGKTTEFMQTVNVNAPPTVASLTPTPGANVPRGTIVTLTADMVAAGIGGTIAAVRFYFDANHNGTLDAGDPVVGTDANATGGYTLTFSTGRLPLGNRTYFARAVGNSGLLSAPVTTTITIT